VLTPAELASVDSGNFHDAQANISTAGTVGLLIQMIDNHTRPIVPDLYIISMRLFELCATSPLGVMLAESAVSWCAAAWSSAVEKEGFRFSTPRLARADIESSLNSLKPGLQGLAQLLLCILPYVGVSLGREFINALEAAQSGSIPANW